MVRKRNALPTTETELKLTAAAAIIGLRSRWCEIGYRMPAAIGTPRALYTRRGQNWHVCPAIVNHHNLQWESKMSHVHGRRPCVSSPSRTKTLFAESGGSSNVQQSRRLLRQDNPKQEEGGLTHRPRSAPGVRARSASRQSSRRQ